MTRKFWLSFEKILVIFAVELSFIMRMSILDLPQETLSQILLSLPVSAIINCAKACKYIKGIVDQDHIWRTLCEIIHGVDTIKNKQYSGQWRRIFSEGKAPWINLKDKRYIRKTIDKAERTGECIESSISEETLVLNWTTHYSSSYSPSNTHAVAIMSSDNFEQKQIEGFENLHFKKAGNYLLAFEMDQFSCIYPQGITTEKVMVFKYDPNNLPKSIHDAQYTISAKSAKYATEPTLLHNSSDPQLIYYASTTCAPANRDASGPYIVEIFDLKTNNETPIKKQKLIGNAYCFSGDYVVLTKTGKTDRVVYLAKWKDFTDETRFGDLWKYDGAIELKHLSEVSSVHCSQSGLIACEEKSGTVTIWSVKENSPKKVKTIDIGKLTKSKVYRSLLQFHSNIFLDTVKNIDDTCQTIFFTVDPAYLYEFDDKFLNIVFNPNSKDMARNSCMIIDWHTQQEVNLIISPLKLYFNATPIYTKRGNFSGKMLLNMRGRTDILYASSPYLAKKFNVAVLTSDSDKIVAKRATTIFGNLAEDCKTLIGLSNTAALTSQVLLKSGSVRYVLLFEEDVLKPKDEVSDTKTPLTTLLHLSVLSHHDHSPYGGLDFSGLDPEKKNPSMRRGNETVHLKDLRINGACLLMKEEQSSEFGWVPVDLEHNLELLLGDLERDMRTLYNAYHGFK